MKIEMVVSALDVAGLEMVVAGLIRNLNRMGHDAGVTCIERTGELGEQLRAEGYCVTIVPTPGVRTNLWPTELARWFRRRSPDVVHAHSGSWLKAVRAGRLARVPRTVYTLHGIWPQPPWYIPIYSRLAASFTDQIVAVSHSLRTHLLEAFHVQPGKVEVIENGIDTDRFAPGDRSGWLRAELGLAPDTAIVGTVGRLHPVKNHGLLIDAFERVRHSIPDAALVIVGEGELRPALEQHIRERQLEGAVFLRGASANVLPYYHEFDLFVLPSILEGTSISALEAMACGLCVVATAVGGNPRLLGNGEYGVLVPGQDAEALAAALCALLADPARRSALGRAARQRTVEHYHDRVVAQRYLQLYNAASAG